MIRGFVDIDSNSLLNVIHCEVVHTRGHNLILYKGTVMLTQLPFERFCLPQHYTD